MLVPSSNTPNDNTQLLIPIDAQRALEIAVAHIRKPEYEYVLAWYHVGRNTRFNLEAIRTACQAEEVGLSVSYCRPGDNFITKHFEFDYYSLFIKNPKTLPGQITAGRTPVPLESIQVYNSGNMEYAGMIFPTHQARVKAEFIPELERHGFKCWEAGDPYKAIYNGPFRNVETLDEAFGPGAREWVEAHLRGEGPECFVINRD